MPGVVAYVYTFDASETPETVIAARPDGSASVTLTPTVGESFANLFVFSRSADGTVSERNYYSFYVHGPAGG